MVIFSYVNISETFKISLSGIARHSAVTLKYTLFVLGFTQRLHNVIYAPAKIATSTGLGGDKIHYMALIIWVNGVRDTALCDI